MKTVVENDDFAGEGGRATANCLLPAGQANRVCTWTSVALVVIIFLAGLSCGAAAMYFMGPEDKSKMNWGDLLDRCAKRMQQGLDLTEAQQARIDAIVRAHQPKLDQIRARTLGETRAELQEVIEEASAVLTSDQEKVFRASAQPRLDKHFPPGGGLPERNERLLSSRPPSSKLHSFRFLQQKGSSCGG